MNLNQALPFVIFPKDVFKYLTDLIKSQDEFHCWLILQKINKENDFEEVDLEAAVQYYQQITNENWFIDLQLKFFLIRNSKNRQNDLGTLLKFWIQKAKNKFPSNSIVLYHSIHPLTSTESVKEYGKYYYSQQEYLDYIESWNSSTVDLNDWNKYKYLSIPEDLVFVKKWLEKRNGLNFSESHMRKLFDQYVEEIYKSKFLPRLYNSILAENEKTIIDRVLKNTGNEDDKKYLNELCTNFYSWRTISTNLSRSLSNTIQISELDIHSQLHFAGYFALIKYAKELTAKPKKKKVVKSAMWFKNAPSEKLIRDEVEESLKDVFDNINRYCPKATWRDFKSIFSKNGVKTKIEWTGDASILNFLFRTLHKNLSFEGAKWDVVTHYFYKSDQNDRSLDPKKLGSNSHYQNIELENHLKMLIRNLGK